MQARCAAPLLVAFLGLPSAPLCALGILLAGSPAALAADLPPIITARLDYARAPGCPSEAVLRAEVARRLGQDPFVDAAPLRVVATITRQKDTLVGSLELYDSAGHSLWSKPSSSPAAECLDLVRGMAVALAFRLDPLVYPPPPVEPPPPPPKPKNAPPPLRAEPPAPVPAAWRGAVGLGPQVVIGAVGPAVGLVFYLGLRGPVLSPGMNLSLGMEFRYDAPSSAVVEDRPGVSVQKFLMGGSLVGCLQGAHLFGCALASGGVISIASKGFDSSNAARPALGYVGAGVRFGFEEPLQPWLAVRVYGEGLVSLRPLRVAIDDEELRTPVLSFPLSGAVGAGLVAYFEGPR